MSTGLTGASFFEVGGVCTAVVDWHRGAPLPSTFALMARVALARCHRTRDYHAIFVVASSQDGAVDEYSVFALDGREKG